MPALLNAANELAVAAFLDERIRFNEIAHVIESVLNGIPRAAAEQLDDVLQADAAARVAAQDWLSRYDR
ncbi:1-deoxy-D-xylulose 5-phosphate reductoisomerase [compost metagenome]